MLYAAAFAFANMGKVGATWPKALGTYGSSKIICHLIRSSVNLMNQSQIGIYPEHILKKKDLGCKV
jgi:hypothetical protein